MNEQYLCSATDLPTNTYYNRVKSHCELANFARDISQHILKVYPRISRVEVKNYHLYKIQMQFQKVYEPNMPT